MRPVLMILAIVGFGHAVSAQGMPCGDVAMFAWHIAEYRDRGVAEDALHARILLNKFLPGLNRMQNAMITDIYANPDLTPMDSAEYSEQACGWPRKGRFTHYTMGWDH